MESAVMVSVTIFFYILRSNFLLAFVPVILSPLFRETCTAGRIWVAGVRYSSE